MGTVGQPGWGMWYNRKGNGNRGSNVNNVTHNGAVTTATPGTKESQSPPPNQQRNEQPRWGNCYKMGQGNNGAERGTGST